MLIKGEPRKRSSYKPFQCHAVIQKMTNKSAKFEIIKAFLPGMCALFSPEILQTGAVKGLTRITKIDIQQFFH